MPELPEVETVKRRLEKTVLGKEIRAARVLNPALRKPVPRNFASRVKSFKIAAIRRRAKYLLIDLVHKDRPALTWLVHLGMSGRLVYFDERHGAQKYTCVLVHFQDGSTLLHNDIRRFGLSLLGSPDGFIELAELGPEPLEEEFDGKYLFTVSRGRQCTIKALVMNQKIVVGVGNIYANEALFSAGILPTRHAGSLDENETKKLGLAIKEVLHFAINSGGSSINDFLDSDGRSGSYQDEFRVYSRVNTPCIRCAGTITKIKHDGRSSFICVTCQQ